MSQYKGRYQRRLEKSIAEGAAAIYINWVNISEKEAASGGADRCTELLLAAGYRPDGAGVVENMRGQYEAGEKDEAGNYIRIPQETWRKKEEIKK